MLTCNFFRNEKIFGIRRIILSVFFLLGSIIFRMGLSFSVIVSYSLYISILVLLDWLVSDSIKNMKKYLFHVELIFRWKKISEKRFTDFFSIKTICYGSNQ